MSLHLLGLRQRRRTCGSSLRPCGSRSCAWVPSPASLRTSREKLEVASKPAEEIEEEDTEGVGLHKGSFSLAYGTLTLLRVSKMHLERNGFYGLLGPNQCPPEALPGIVDKLLPVRLMCFRKMASSTASSLRLGRLRDGLLLLQRLHAISDLLCKPEATPGTTRTRSQGTCRSCFAHPEVGAYVQASSTITRSLGGRWEPQSWLLVGACTRLHCLRPSAAHTNPSMARHSYPRRFMTIFRASRVNSELRRLPRYFEGGHHSGRRARDVRRVAAGKAGGREEVARSFGPVPLGVR